MRNAFLVLVSLCIGVTSRFIVPSTVSETFLSSINQLAKVDKKSVSVNATPMILINHDQLPFNRTDESALYEHAATKSNNQSERALIYINQKHKKSNLLQKYFKIASSYQQPKPQVIIGPRYNEPYKSKSEAVNPYYKESDYPVVVPVKTAHIPSYFGSSTLFNCNNEPLNLNYNRMQNQQRTENVIPYNRLTNDHHDYMELLKSPILRTLVRLQPRYDGVQASQLPHVNNHDFLKVMRQSKYHNSNPNSIVHERNNEAQRGYGLNSEYEKQSSDQNNAFIQRVEEPQFHEKFINYKKSSVPDIEKAQDDDRLLHHYLKESLRDQVTNKKKLVVPNDCRHRYCNIIKTSSVGHLQHKKNLECNCGHQLKQNETTILKKRQGREINKRNKTSKIYQTFLPSDVTKQ